MGFREAGFWKGHSLSFALGKHSAYLTSIQPHRLRYSVQGMAPSHIDKDITANYEMENLELASGGFGKVFRATDRKHPERRVAIKSMLLSSARRREMSENEVKIMPLALTMPQMIFDMEWRSICTLHAHTRAHTHTHIALASSVYLYRFVYLILFRLVLVACRHEEIRMHVCVPVSVPLHDNKKL